MPSLIDPVLRIMRRDRPHADGVCAVCHRPLSETDDRFDLRTGTPVHRSCASFRMRVTREAARRTPVTARRSALHLGD